MLVVVFYLSYSVLATAVDVYHAVSTVPDLFSPELKLSCVNKRASLAECVSLVEEFRARTNLDLTQPRDVHFLSRKLPPLMQTLDLVWPRVVEIFSAPKYANVGTVSDLRSDVFALGRTSAVWPFWSNLVRDVTAENIIFNLKNVVDVHYFRPAISDHFRSLCDTFPPMHLRYTALRSSIRKFCESGNIYELTRLMDSQTMDGYDTYANGVEDVEEGISARGEQLGLLTARFSDIFLSEATYRSLQSTREEVRSVVPMEIATVRYLKCFTVDSPRNCVEVLERMQRVVQGHWLFPQVYLAVRTELFQSPEIVARMVETMRSVADFAGVRIRNIDEGFMKTLLCNGPDSEFTAEVVDELTMLGPTLPFFKFAIKKKNKWPFLNLLFQPFPEAHALLAQANETVMEQDMDENVQAVFEETDISHLIEPMERHIVDNLKHAILASMRTPLHQIFMKQCNQFPRLNRELDLDAHGLAAPVQRLVEACRQPSLPKTVKLFEADMAVLDPLLKAEDFAAVIARVEEVFDVFGPGAHATAISGIGATCFICLKESRGRWLAICNDRQTLHADCLNEWIRISSPTAKCPNCRAVF